MMELEFEEDGCLEVGEYNELRKIVGWKMIKEERAKKDLSHTWYKNIVRNKQGDLVAIARVIGNGGYFYFLVDVIVHPLYQHQGIGRRMLDNVVRRMEKESSENDRLVLAVISARDKEEFYKGAGFKMLPDNSTGGGLIRWFER